MTQHTDIGTFYQGQAVTIAVSPADTATDEDMRIMKENDIYVGIYGEKVNEKHIFSTADGTATRSVDEETGKVTISCILPAATVSRMHGRYTMEMLVKSGDSTFTAPSINLLSFNVEPRRLAEVIR